MNYIKHILSIAALFAVTLTLSAQPDAVVTAFKLQYPEAEKVEWEEESETWKAEFWMNDKQSEATYTPDGTWIGSEIELAATELPAKILRALERDFPGYKVLECEVNTDPEQRWYEVEVKINGEFKEVAYNVLGERIPNIEDDDDGNPEDILDDE